MIVYHYTSEDAFNQIMRDSSFRPSSFSTALDATYGEGWYFTDLAPHVPDSELCQIWGRCVPERVNRCLVFDIDDSLLQNTRPHVYRLPLERIQGGVIMLVNYYIKDKIVIRFMTWRIRR